MTPRERFQAVIDGRKVDSIPAVMRLDPWYNARKALGELPDEIRDMSLAELEHYLGFGRSARKAAVFTESFSKAINVVEFEEQDVIIKEWHTPSGVMTMKSRWLAGDREAGLRPSVIQYPLNRREDYAVLAELYSNICYTPDYSGYQIYDRQIGDAGLPMVILGASPLHELMLRWAGYENAYMHLFDFPKTVLDAVEVIEAKYREMWPIVAQSQAELVMHGVNFDAATTPPKIFEKYFVPYLRDFVEMMHRAGKKVAFHADGNMAGLLELILDIGYDVADCFACHPLVPCTAAQARAAWRDRITIWGGIPSNMLDADTPITTLEGYLTALYRDMSPGDHFILGISDQALPTATWEHIKTIADYHRRHGRIAAEK